MGLGGCILLIAVGAILTFATDWEMDGLNVTVTGVIMMAVGLIGVAVFTSIARRRRAAPPVAQTTVVEPDQQPRGY
ncbi:DUF6458 family protein [Streptomyces sp. KL118A]|uniref:DUF6458 family protein n=1 Tax=Streptomyces sp. KL118A TaxID=3045153 RepID=UPI00278BB3EE|nr:DUF6458 family protein [Streptomyces sp. KL118A]